MKLTTNQARRIAELLAIAFESDSDEMPIAACCDSEDAALMRVFSGYSSRLDAALDSIGFPNTTETINRLRGAIA